MTHLTQSSNQFNASPEEEKEKKKKKKKKKKEGKWQAACLLQSVTRQRGVAYDTRSVLAKVLV